VNRKMKKVDPSGSPLLDRLVRMAENPPVSFHTPGHKNGRLFQRPGTRSLPSFLPSIDTTELPETDHLHHATGVILNAQRRAAETFGSEETYFLVNGSTCGIYAMIMSAAGHGDEIIINRNAHQSVYNACLLGGVTPRYLKPPLHHALGLPLAVTAESVTEALTEWPAAKAVLITTPTYHGFTADLAGIARIVHQQGKMLLVDEAHGAHLLLSRRLPPTALECGADAAVQSTHKTLGAFTQAAMLHVQGSRIDRDRLKYMLTLHQSSSPSYLLLSSLDLAVTLVRTQGPAIMEALLDLLEDLQSRLMALPHLLMNSVRGESGELQTDPTRLWLDLHQTGLTGYQLNERLRNTYNIQMEYADNRGALAILTIGNTPDDLDRLRGAVTELTEKPFSHTQIDTPKPPDSLPKVRLSLREAAGAARKTVRLSEAAGCVSAVSLVPYPPGVPLLVPGEVIEPELIHYLQQTIASGNEVLGMKDPENQKIEVAVIQ
jgi:arginine/lysine/ornithine decarboxylase